MSPELDFYVMNIMIAATLGFRERETSRLSRILFPSFVASKHAQCANSDLVARMHCSLDSQLLSVIAVRVREFAEQKRKREEVSKWDTPTDEQDWSKILRD